MAMGSQDGAWRLEKELLALRQRAQQETEVREALHAAVAARHANGVRAALDQGLLLACEVRWARQELVLVETEDETQRKRDAVRLAIARSKDQSKADDMVEAIAQARDIGLPADEICGAELDLLGLRNQEKRRMAEDSAWQEVVRVIESGNVVELLETLQRYSGALPEQRIHEAQMKIPGMKVRAETRKELLAAMKNKDNTIHLRQVISTVRKSILPSDEIARAERVLEEAELQKTKRACAPPEIEAAASPKPDPPAIPKPVDVATPARQPSTQLEKAVQAKDRAQIQAAIVALKASGASAREISQLHARAVATFGNSK